MYEEALKSLIASGPLAILLGVAVVMLWRKVAELAKQVEAKGTDYATRLDTIRTDQQDREDAMRVHYEARFDSERAVNKADLRALTEVLQGYTEE